MTQQVMPHGGVPGEWAEPPDGAWKTGGPGVPAGPGPEEVTHPPDEPSKLPPGRTNAIGHMLGVVGDEWNLLIMREAMFGVTRYGEWRRRLPISHAVLTRRLRRLTELGVFTRAEYQRGRHEYRLGRRGRGVWPILLSLWWWESTWLSDRPGRLPPAVHRGCGRNLPLVVTCAACGEPVGPRDVRAELGPSGAWSRWMPEAATRRRAVPPEGRPPLLYPRSTALIGNRWSAAILGGAFQGLRRFREFEVHLGAPPAIVADRLRAFCEIGVFRQVAEDGRADRPAYRLTGKGRAFFPVILTCADWAERWFHAPEGPAVLLSHPAGGHALRPWLACGACGLPLRAADVGVAGCGR
jgi:Predicted transcriptional regulators